ncbi:hypothetical protein GCM10029976_060960 [Kribbella albertanoniae]|uniref:DUF4352 domain-containing protein n=1 Tax=Kribbella albertanoniae TaxID=1266829 RepID=A0A4R4PLJ5_9ACTN|nr:hypothetical protein [Kribbella albertanoniae]TDC22894.1 hypothetical protein E1261_29750 [Kribbella albertanoniae]
MKLYRPATILVGILFVLIGGLTRLATPDQVFDEPNMMVSDGTIGQPLEFGKEATITVVRMQLAKSVLDANSTSDKKPIETNGVYVALEWETTPGVDKPDNPQPTLVSDGGVVFNPVPFTYSGLEFGASGFTVSGGIVFEVDPAELKGLTLQVRTGQLWNVLNRMVSVDLGIPGEESAQRLVDGAVEQYVLPERQTRVAS